MIIREFSVQNFLCFPEETRLVFQPPEPGRNVYLIGGKNGQGKTSLRRALEVCLFGLEGRPDRIWNEVHSGNRERGEQKVVFRLAFLDDNGQEAELWRVYRPVRQQWGTPQYDMLLTLEVSGEKVEEDNDAIQGRIGQFFPKEVARFFLFDGEEIKQLAESTEQHETEQIKGAIEELLGLKLFQTLQEDLRNVMADLDREADLTRQSDIARLQSEVARLCEEEETLRRRKAELTEERRRQEARHVKTEREFEELETEFSDWERLRSQARELGDKRDKLEESIADNVEKTLAVALVADHIQQIVERAEQEQTQRAEGRGRTILAERIDALLAELRDDVSCLCGRSLPEARFQEVEARLRGLLIGEGGDKTSQPLFELSGQQITALRRQYEAAAGRASLADLCARSQETQTRLDACEQELRGLENPEGRADRRRELRQIQDEVSQKLAKARTDLETVSKQLSGYPALVDTARGELQRKSDQLQRSERARVLSRLADDSVNVLEELFTEVRCQKTADLQRHTTDILRLLWRKRATLSRVEVDGESYATTIILNGDTPINKSELSAGEKELFALALLGGLAKCADCNPPIVIDTPLSRLDSEHRANIVSRYYPTAGEQVVLLSTDTEITADLYELLKPSIRQTFTLTHDERTRSTRIQSGYFPSTTERQGQPEF